MSSARLVPPSCKPSIGPARNEAAIHVSIGGASLSNVLDGSQPFVFVRGSVDRIGPNEDSPAPFEGSLGPTRERSYAWLQRSWSCC